MSVARKSFLAVLMLGLAGLLTACLPPALFPFGVIYEVVGEPVTINVAVANNPGSVNCTNTENDIPISMSKDSGDVWTGTFNDSDLVLGENPIQCRASNNSGSSSQTVGMIVVIENTPPTLVTFVNVTVYDDDGNTSINEPLVDTDQSSHLDGAEFALDDSSVDDLPADLSIDSSNGNLVGTTTAGPLVIDVTLLATTVAGSDTSDVTITIESGPEPD